MPAGARASQKVHAMLCKLSRLKILKRESIVLETPDFSFFAATQKI
jgi:hypothetical protein